MGCSTSTLSLLLIIFFLLSVFHPLQVHAGIMLSPSPATQPDPALHLPCDGVPDKCDIQSYRVTACVIFVGNGSSYVSVVNKGATSLQLHMIVADHPPNVKLEGLLVIPAHQVKKVNLPSHIGGGSSVVVKVGNDQECTIHFIPQGFYTSYMMPYMTARNGTYLLFAAACLLLIGGSWALVKKTRHFDGVPYRELEFSSTITIEAQEGWDQSWDNDDDDEEEWDR